MPNAIFAYSRPDFPLYLPIKKEMPRIVTYSHSIVRRIPRHPRSWHFRRWCGRHSISLPACDFALVEAFERQRQATGYIRAIVGAMPHGAATTATLVHYIAWLRHLKSADEPSPRLLVCGPASVRRTASGLRGLSVRRAPLSHPGDLRGCAFDMALLLHSHTAQFTPLFCAVAPTMELVGGSVLIIQGNPSVPSGFARFFDQVACGRSASFLIASTQSGRPDTHVVVRSVTRFVSAPLPAPAMLPVPHCCSPAPPAFVAYAAAAAAPQPLLAELSQAA